MRTVFVNGCFDFITFAHNKLFEYAASLGDYVIVAIDSDERVRERKGEGRPFYNIHQRKYNLERNIDIMEVLIFSTDEQLEELVKKNRPDAMVVGDEYKDKKVIGAEYAKEIYFFDLPRVTSSSEVINKLNQ